MKMLLEKAAENVHVYGVGIQLRRPPKDTIEKQ
jgi:hypothetical protein